MYRSAWRASSTLQIAGKQVTSKFMQLATGLSLLLLVAVINRSNSAHDMKKQHTTQAFCYVVSRLHAKFPFRDQRKPFGKADPSETKWRRFARQQAHIFHFRDLFALSKPWATKYLAWCKLVAHTKCLPTKNRNAEESECDMIKTEDVRSVSMAS